MNGPLREPDDGRPRPDGSLRPLLDVLGDTLTGDRLRLVRRAHLVAFGEPIVELLRGLRRLDDLERRPAGWLLTTDERVLTLKLADRLHNQRTMRFLPEDRRRKKSQETLDFVALLAGQAGQAAVRRPAGHRDATHGLCPAPRSRRRPPRRSRAAVLITVPVLAAGVRALRTRIGSGDRRR